ncbi:MAG: eL32 family ribosomal protein [Candidatus Acidifodinimicrobium sp.]
MEFKKRDSSKLKRLGFSWRKPRGKKNRTRLGHKGHAPIPSKGFKGNSSSRFKISGLQPVLVRSMMDIAGLDKDKNIAIIAGSIGALKRNKILDECKTKGIKVLNYGKRTEDTEKISK